MNEELVRPAVKDIPDYVPGKSAPGAIKLSSNENPFGPSPKALRAIAKAGKGLQAYPDQMSINLRQALASRFKLPVESFICGNGADDILQIIGETYIKAGDEVIVSKNVFSVYELIARLYDGELVFVPLRDFELDLNAIAAAVTPKTKIIFLTNPNNPTGTIFSASQFDAFMKIIPESVLVVVDEAYAEFSASKDFPKTIDYVKSGAKVLVIRTFSKYYGLAGLRAGYCIGRPELIAPMFKTKMPFNVNRLAQAGAIAALGDSVFLKKTYQNNLTEKTRLYREFESLGLEYKESEANFILVNIKRPAKDFCQELIGLGVSVRPLTSFGFPEAIRISIGTPTQNKKLIAALKKAL
jgi:histidinol-phosphate aminotransferase